MQKRCGMGLFAVTLLLAVVASRAVAEELTFEAVSRGPGVCVWIRVEACCIASEVAATVSVPGALTPSGKACDPSGWGSSVFLIADRATLEAECDEHFGESWWEGGGEHQTRIDRYVSASAECADGPAFEGGTWLSYTLLCSGGEAEAHTPSTSNTGPPEYEAPKIEGVRFRAPVSRRSPSPRRSPARAARG